VELSPELLAVTSTTGGLSGEQITEITQIDLRIARQSSGMSDTADDIGFHGRQLLNKSKTNPLREQMRAFIEQHNETELKQLRSQVSTGESLSEIIKEDRDERL
jgi:hypothetical protein